MRNKAASLATPNSAQAEPMMDMNMTPLIDVMLVLIIMLIISIPKQHHATTIGMPSIAAQTTQPVVVSIEVDFDGTILWDGLVVGSRSALEAKLDQVARAAVPPQLQLRANKLAPYKAVAGIMATAQRSGVMNIGIIGNEQFI
jgi:biopolymer transport protein ExbD